jgi:hypothetical protein
MNSLLITQMSSYSSWYTQCLSFHYQGFLNQYYLRINRTVVSFHKKKRKEHDIYISLYDSNKYLVFKRILTRNILEIMLLYNKNLIIIIILQFSLQSIFIL